MALENGIEISEEASEVGVDLSDADFAELMSPSGRAGWEHGLIDFVAGAPGWSRERRWFCGRRLELDLRRAEVGPGPQATFEAVGDGLHFLRTYERQGADVLARVSLVLAAGAPLDEDTIRRELRRDALNSLRQLRLQVARRRR